jgi:hypothetical protein
MRPGLPQFDLGNETFRGSLLVAVCVQHSLFRLRARSIEFARSTVPRDCGYGGTSALALAVEAVEALHVSFSIVTSGLA